tara:strand:- start:59 stop:280 length:222 start_codon:yes stop_codon:yes gene_type:complete
MLISKFKLEDLRLNKRQQKLVNPHLISENGLTLESWTALSELDRTTLKHLKMLIQVELGEVELKELMSTIREK